MQIGGGIVLYLVCLDPTTIYTYKINTDASFDVSTYEHRCRLRLPRRSTVSRKLCSLG